MSENFIECYNTIFTRANILRTRCPDADGLGFWKSIKDKLAIYDELQAPSWKSLPEDITRDVLSLPEYYILGNGEKVIDEPNHFLIQQFRLPLQNKPTFRKIMQVALNAGQFHPNKNRDTIPNLILDNYNSHKYWQLDRYLDMSTINQIGCFNKIPESFVNDISETLDQWLSDNCP